MLTAYNILRAMGGVREAYVLDTVNALNLLNEGDKPRRSTRRFWRVALIAALLTALLTACAVGYSIHQRRQQELRELMQIDLNRVDGYREYTEQDSAAGKEPSAGKTEITPHIDLISSIQQGAYQMVYFSVAPVTEEEARTFLFDSFVTGFVCIAGNEEAPEVYWHQDVIQDKKMSKGYAEPAYIMLEAENDAAHRTGDGSALDPNWSVPMLFQRCYDAQTQSLMLQTAVYRGLVDFSRPVYFSVRCLDFLAMRLPGESYEVTSEPTAFELGEPIYKRDYGVTVLEGEDATFSVLPLSSPIRLINETNGKSCEIISVRLSASGVEWRLRHEGLDENPVEWYSFYDAVLGGAYLTYADGGRKNMQRSHSAVLTDDTVTMFCEWSGTVDVNSVEGICIMGKIYSF